MVLKKEIHSHGYKQKLIDFAMGMRNMALADQTIMNSFFNNPIPSLNSNYNCLKRCFRNDNFKFFSDNVKIIHYVGAKPWDKVKLGFEKGYTKIEQLWHNEKELMDKDKAMFKKSNIPSNNLKKVLIVGNSPNILKYEVGNKIDEFDYVIRINDFKTKGFEKYVGSKTDYWLTSFSPAIDIRQVESFKGIFTANSNWTDGVFNSRIKRIVPNSHLNKVEVLSKNSLTKLKKRIGYTNSLKWPTSGLLAIESAIQKFKGCEIYIHGFSFFKESSKYVSHYWKETKKEEFNRHHDHIIEEKYVQSLIDSNVIKKLI